MPGVELPEGFQQQPLESDLQGFRKVTINRPYKQRSKNKTEKSKNDRAAKQQALHGRIQQARDQSGRTTRAGKYKGPPVDTAPKATKPRGKPAKNPSTPASQGMLSKAGNFGRKVCQAIGSPQEIPSSSSEEASALSSDDPSPPSQHGHDSSFYPSGSSSSASSRPQSRNNRGRKKKGSKDQDFQKGKQD